MLLEILPIDSQLNSRLANFSAAARFRGKPLYAPSLSIGGNSIGLGFVCLWRDFRFSFLCAHLRN